MHPVTYVILAFMCINIIWCIAHRRIDAAGIGQRLKVARLKSRMQAIAHVNWSVLTVRRIALATVIVDIADKGREFVLRDYRVWRYGTWWRNGRDIYPGIQDTARSAGQRRLSDTGNAFNLTSVGDVVGDWPGAASVIDRASIVNIDKELRLNSQQIKGFTLSLIQWSQSPD